MLFLLLALTGLLQVTASCSKSIKNQMAVQPMDSIPASPVQNDTVTRTYLALGDSYTIGTSVPPGDSYPAQTVVALNGAGKNFSDPQIIATDGWTTVNLLNALNDQTTPLGTYDIVTLLIGVNDQYQGGTQQEYRTNFISLLKMAITFAGNQPSHVIVISIPDYSVTPFGKATGKTAYIAAQIDSFNMINKQVSDSCKTNYLNVTDESRKAATDPSLIASDQLHFSGKEYAIWAGMLAPLIEKIIK